MLIPLLKSLTSTIGGKRAEVERLQPRNFGIVYQPGTIDEWEPIPDDWEDEEEWEDDEDDW